MRILRGFDCETANWRFQAQTEYDWLGSNRKEHLMNTLVFALLIQAATTSFIVSTKAGVVNYVQGASTVKAATVIPAGKAFSTGRDGKLEMLLNPGSYLRLGENTQVILDKVELYDIAL